jgi:hypothetical protein
MSNFLDIIGDTEIGAGVSPDELALAQALMNSVSGIEDEALDVDLDGVGDVEIGAGPTKRRISSAQFKAMLQKAAVKGKTAGVAQGMALGRTSAAAARPAVRSSTPDRAESAILGFARDAANGGLVAAGATVTLEAEPQAAFKPEALIVDDNVAKDFVIEDIKIGTQTLFVNTSAVPCSMFTADGVLGKMLLEKTGQASQKITIKVRNISVSQRPFYGAMVGWKAEK